MAIVVVAIAGLSQLLLPWIATRVLRRRFADDGRVLSASVGTFPAVRLLWGHADWVALTFESYDVKLSGVGGMLDEALDIDRVDVHINTLRTNLIPLDHVTFEKRGRELVVRAGVASSISRPGAPEIRGLKLDEPASSVDRHRLNVSGIVDVLGLSSEVTAALQTSDGKLFGTVSGVLGTLPRVTLFANPRIDVQTVTGHTTDDGIAVTLTARTS